MWSARKMAEMLRAAADEPGKISSIDMLVRMLRRWECGAHIPSEQYQILYCKAFRVSEDELFGQFPEQALVGDESGLPDLPDSPSAVGKMDVETSVLIASPSGSAIPLHPAASELMPDPDLLSRITSALEDESRADSAIISWLEVCLGEHRRVEDTIGSGPQVDIIKSQLSTVVRFARQAPTPLTDQIVDLGAQYAQFMAWLSGDQGNNAAALAWYDRSHDWAMEAGDANMAATTLSMKAHLAWSVGDSVRCVRLGEAARWTDERTSPGVQGMATQMIARGHAIGSDPDNAHRAIDSAQALIVTAAEHPEDEPPWMYFYGETWFTAQRGMIETELAERGKGKPQYAVALLERALSDLPESYRRDRAWYGAMLARAHAAADDYDAAVGIGVKFAADAVAVNKHAVGELKRLSARLNQRGARQVRDLADALSGGR